MIVHLLLNYSQLASWAMRTPQLFKLPVGHRHNNKAETCEC